MSGKLKSTIIIVAAGGTLFATHALFNGNQKFYSEVAMPMLHKITTPECGHYLAVKLAKFGVVPRIKNETEENLRINVLGRRFDNPIGLAAGFDKDCEAISGMLKMGFGFVEVGAVTPEPQPGNAKPRVFRLEEDKAIINRYGFNSVGHEKALKNFLAWSDKEKAKGGSPNIVGVNLGKNKTTEDPAIDFVKGVEVFGPIADFLVINVSSPNTPGLRSLQGPDQLRSITDQVVKARDKLQRTAKPPIFVKIAPDLTEKDRIDIATVVAAKNSGISGLIVSNTTLKRPESLKSSSKSETGGLSGQPVRDMSTELIQDMYRLTSGRLVIIGVGGVSSGQDALEKIKAGASLIQIYTALVYHGPPVVNKIKRELSELLKQEGFTSVSQAVGVKAKEMLVQNQAT